MIVVPEGRRGGEDTPEITPVNTESTPPTRALPSIPSVGEVVETIEKDNVGADVE